MTTLWHFEFKGAERWESIGSGLGVDGEDPLGAPLDEVRRLSGGVLPPGLYQVIESRGDSLWRTFEVGPAGAVE